MKKLLLIVFLISFIHINATAQESKKEAKERKKEEQYQQILEIVNTQYYGFQADKAITQKGRNINLAGRGNSLVVEHDKSAASLPYFGRAYSGGYSSSDSGIDFNGVMETYEVDRNEKKHKVTIKYSIKGVDDHFKCTLIVSGVDNASLSVVSNRRQSISYNGSISEVVKENKEKE